MEEAIRLLLGPRSYFESGGSDKWLKVVGLQTLFSQLNSL